MSQQIDNVVAEIDASMKRLRQSMRGIQIRTAGFKKDHDALARGVADFTGAPDRSRSAREQGTQAGTPQALNRTLTTGEGRRRGDGREGKTNRNRDARDGVGRAAPREHRGTRDGGGQCGPVRAGDHTAGRTGKENRR